MDYPTDKQGYKWAKKDEEWYYWNGTAWLPGTPPEEIAPSEKGAVYMKIIVVVAILLVVAVGIVMFLPQSQSTCDCIGGCEQEALSIQLEPKQIALADSLGLTYDEANIVTGLSGQYYKNDNVDIMVGEHTPSFETYQKLLMLYEWEEVGEENGFHLYSLGDYSLALKQGAIIMATGSSATEYLQCV